MTLDAFCKDMQKVCKIQTYGQTYFRKNKTGIKVKYKFTVKIISVKK